MSELCQQYGAFFHTDTVQTIGNQHFDLQKVHVDFLTASAHKFHGPKGVGFIYKNNDIAINPFLDGGSQENNRRAGTHNVPGIVAMGLAIEIAHKSIDETRGHILKLKSHLMKELINNVGGIKFNGDTTEQYSNHKVLSVLFPEDTKYNSILNDLMDFGIAVSGKSACSTDSNKPSHVLQAIGVPTNQSTVRFSFSKFNRLSDIDYVIEKLLDIEATKGSYAQQ